uniref:Putative trypsin-like serine protease n=1 Tax=Xenopsylla cheopis TaxID=163159 RepID=A0A6M2DY27_XENCH
MFRHIIIFSTIICLGLCDNRMVQGNDVDIRAFGWQLSLNGNFKHFCGAAIISNEWALTTGFCAQQYFIEASRVRSGSNYYNESGTLHRVQLYITHPKYDKRTLDYDVALIQVSDVFNRSYTARPVPLVDANVSLPTGSVVTATGWGAEKYLGNPVRHLRAISLHVVDFQECRAKYNSSIEITNRVFCAASRKNDNKSVCTWDFGGPVVNENGVLVGLISYSTPDCSTKPLPNIFTHLANPEIREFIKKRTGI